MEKEMELNNGSKHGDVITNYFTRKEARVDKNI